MSRIVVDTRKGLKDAISEKYEEIVVTGDLAKEIKWDLNNAKKDKLNKLSNLSLVVGLFLWPFLAAGVIGKIMTKDDFKKYNVKMEGDWVIFTRK